jgi:hypothetical protein
MAMFGSFVFLMFWCNTMVFDDTLVLDAQRCLVVTGETVSDTAAYLKL